MRVQATQDFAWKHTHKMKVGQVFDAPDDRVQEWLRLGWVVKHQPAEPKETKRGGSSRKGE